MFQTLLTGEPLVPERFNEDMSSYLRNGTIPSSRPAAWMAGYPEVLHRLGRADSFDGATGPRRLVPSTKQESEERRAMRARQETLPNREKVPPFDGSPFPTCHPKNANKRNCCTPASFYWGIGSHIPRRDYGGDLDTVVERMAIIIDQLVLSRNAYSEVTRSRGTRKLIKNQRGLKLPDVTGRDNRALRHPLQP